MRAILTELCVIFVLSRNPPKRVFFDQGRATYTRSHQHRSHQHSIERIPSKIDRSCSFAECTRRACAARPAIGPRGSCVACAVCQGIAACRRVGICWARVARLVHFDLTKCEISGAGRFSNPEISPAATRNHVCNNLLFQEHTCIFMQTHTHAHT